MKYKNISKEVIEIIWFWKVSPGYEFETELSLRDERFELIEDKKVFKKKKNK